MNVVLFPLLPGAEVSLEIRLLDVAADADVLATGFSIAHGEFTDYVLISDDGFAEMATSELEFRGEYAFLRVDRGGAAAVVGDGARGVSALAGRGSGQWSVASGQ